MLEWFAALVGWLIVILAFVLLLPPRVAFTRVRLIDPPANMSDAGSNIDPKEEQEKKEIAEIATKMTNYIDPCLAKVKPLLKLINEVGFLHLPLYLSVPAHHYCSDSCLSLQHLARAKRDQEKDELDEEALVKQVRPLLEQAQGMLQEALGGIKALDPGGKIAEMSKRRAADHQATPEEQHLAESLGEVQSLPLSSIASVHNSYSSDALWI